MLDHNSYVTGSFFSNGVVDGKVNSESDFNENLVKESSKVDVFS